MAYFMLGKMMVRQKMEEQAVGEIETALKVDPDCRWHIFC